VRAVDDFLFELFLFSEAGAGIEGRATVTGSGYTSVFFIKRLCAMLGRCCEG
jgi:hypothetical protein